MEDRLRILFVSGAWVTHTARWIEQLQGFGWHITVFDPDNCKLDPSLKNVVLYTGTPKRLGHPSVNVKPYFPLQRTKVFFRDKLPWLWRTVLLPPPEFRLLKVIRRIRPDVIHVQGMQPPGYVFMRALRMERYPMPPWVYSSMGSDLFLYKDDPTHKPKLQELMGCCPFYLSDCERDLSLAKDLGFKGKFLGVIPGQGGYDIEAVRRFISKGKPSQRRTIAVKGYHRENDGRALVVLEALKQCSDEMLRGYEVVFYACSPVVFESVQDYASRSGRMFRALRRVPDVSEVWKLLGRSILHIAASKSDGTPCSMLEAMILGAFPLQTDAGGATSEWINDNVNGMIIPHDDAPAIADTIKRALASGPSIDLASEKNLALMKQRVARDVLIPRIKSMYESVSTSSGSHNKNGQKFKE